MEQLSAIASTVQLLDDPVPLMVKQLVDVFRLLDTALPEQVIDVPKISPDRVVDRDTRRVDQLVGADGCLSDRLAAARRAGR